LSLLESLYRFSLRLIGIKDVEESYALSRIRKAIKKNSCSKFYKTNTRTAAPDCAVFFYEIYENVCDKQTLLKNAEKSNVLKDIIVEHFLDEEKLIALNNISGAYINSLAEKYPLEEVTKMVNDNINTFSGLFTNEWYDTVNGTYRTIIYYSWFICFDYESLLKSFCNFNLRDLKNFGARYKSKFSSIKCVEIKDMLKDFLSVTRIFSIKVDWKAINLILTKYKQDLAMDEKWTRLYKRIVYVLSSDILTLMIRHSEANPKWENKYSFTSLDFAASHIENTVKNAQDALYGLLLKVKEQEIKELELKIFCGEFVHIARYYTIKEAETSKQQEIKAFTHAKSFEYLVCFMHKYFENIYEMCNVFILKGVWLSYQASINLSQLLYNISECFRKLRDFDFSFSDTGEHAKTIKSFIARYPSGAKYKERMNKSFHVFDKEAEELINETANFFSLLIVSLNALKTERDAQALELSSNILLENWPEVVEAIDNEGFLLTLDSAILKIDDLIKLLQFTNSIESA